MGPIAQETSPVRRKRLDARRKREVGLTQEMGDGLRERLGLVDIGGFLLFLKCFI
jgi:hypothetical protein